MPSHQAVARLLRSKLAPLLKRTVRVHGLSGRPELNGQVGEATLWDDKSGRYGVALPAESVRLQPKNVELVDEPADAAAAGA